MKDKKILVHCSTNMHTSNFGDVLYSFMILKHLQDSGFQAAFYQLSPYIQNYLFNIHALKKENVSLKEADAVIYFAGGYFGEPNNQLLRRKILLFFRFMPFGVKARLCGKPMAIIGLGAGDYLWLPSKLAVKCFCDYADCISVRDAQSGSFLSALSPNSEIHVCSDVAQCVEADELIMDEDLSFDKGYRYIFLHCNNYPDISELFSLGLKDFVSSDSSLRVIVGADCKADLSAARRKAAEIIGTERVITYTYTTPDNLCYTLGKCSLVLTYKLHVGIMSAVMGSSPVAFAKHYKISRYYKQIGESGRCVDYDKASPELIADMAKEYFGKSICLDKSIVNAARENFVLLDDFLRETVK